MVKKMMKRITALLVALVVGLIPCGEAGAITDTYNIRSGLDVGNIEVTRGSGTESVTLTGETGTAFLAETGDKISVPTELIGDGGISVEFLISENPSETTLVQGADTTWNGSSPLTLPGLDSAGTQTGSVHTIWKGLVENTSHEIAKIKFFKMAVQTHFYFAIKYMDGDTEFSGSNSNRRFLNHHTVTSDSIAFTSVSKTGKTSEGWYTSKDTQTADTKIDGLVWVTNTVKGWRDANSNKTYDSGDTLVDIAGIDSTYNVYVKWPSDAPKYSVKYNYGEAKVKTGKTVADVQLSTDATGAKLEDGTNLDYPWYTLAGWSYTSGVKTPDITAAQAKAGLTADQINTAIGKQQSGVINLYAVWELTNYTMTFDNNSGTGTADAKKFTIRSTDVTLPATGFVSGGKPLIGWSTTATGKNASGTALPVYTGTLTADQLKAIVKEFEATSTPTAIKLYAIYGAALKSVEITPKSLTIKIDAIGQANAVAKDEDGNEMTTVAITYSSSDEKVATVDSSGKVTGVGAGKATITATATFGTISVTDSCLVRITKLDNTLKVKGKTVRVKAGKRVFLGRREVISITKAKGSLRFKKTSGSSLIKIKRKTGSVSTNKGLIRGKKYTVKVKVTARGNDKYKSGYKTVKFILYT